MHNLQINFRFSSFKKSVLSCLVRMWRAMCVCIALACTHISVVPWYLRYKSYNVLYASTLLLKVPIPRLAQRVSTGASLLQLQRNAHNLPLSLSSYALNATKTVHDFFQSLWFDFDSVQLGQNDTTIFRCWSNLFASFASFVPTAGADRTRTLAISLATLPFFALATTPVVPKFSQWKIWGANVSFHGALVSRSFGRRFGSCFLVLGASDVVFPNSVVRRHFPHVKKVDNLVHCFRGHDLLNGSKIFAVQWETCFEKSDIVKCPSAWQRVPKCSGW